MPIYEYNCPKCGHFEVIQKVSEKVLKCKPDCTDRECPKKAERLVSAAAFHLKGSGWYKTDYTSSGASSSSSSSSSSDKSSEGSSGKKKDSKESSSDSSTKKDASGKKSSGPCGSGCGCH